MLRKSDVDPTRRGETLVIEEFGKLADELYPQFPLILLVTI